MHFPHSYVKSSVGITLINHMFMLTILRKMLLLNFNFTVKKVEKRKANDEPTDPETPRNKDLKYDREKRTRTFQNSLIDKFPWVVFDENAQEMYCKYCRKFPHLSDRKDALTWGTKNLCIDGLKLHDKHQEHLLCVKHWFKLRNLMIPRHLPALHRPLLTTQ